MDSIIDEIRFLMPTDVSWGPHSPVPQCRVDIEHYLKGVELFNREAFFDAHEVLEDVWRAAPQREKKFLQGLIQVAVALHHHGNGNRAGARSVLKRASRNLSHYPTDFGGLDLVLLLNSLSHWQRALDEGTAVPSLPKMVAFTSERQAAQQRE